MVRIKSVLFPTDFSDSSKEAQVYACAFAEQFAADLHVLHVMQDVMLMIPEPGAAYALPQNYLMEMKEQAERALDGLLPAQWAAGKRVVRATRMGNAAVETVRYAREHDIDLIVLGTHGRTGLKHVLLGSVAERIVRLAPCPVLTVHPAGHQFVVP